MKKLMQKITVAILFLNPNIAFAELPFITIASTTSTENSGLFDYLLPRFTSQTGIAVKIIAQGTGQAIKTAQNGDADILFVHHPPSEIKFVKQGYAGKRYNVMKNDFIIVAPATDPAKIARITPPDILTAFRKIKQHKARFISRGDDSGTHKKELELWQKSKVAFKNADWYFESGASMGATINIAVAKNAYTLTDRSTWIAFNNKADFKIVLQGDKKLSNQYGIAVVSHNKHPHIKTKMAQKFVDWIISPIGQQTINQFKINGQQAFVANYK